MVSFQDRQTGANFCIGRIISVGESYNIDRSVEVECTDGKTSWRDICVLLDPFGHWEGDGLFCTPRVDSICVVGRVPGYDYPVIVGFLKIPSSSDGTMGVTSEDVDFEGDIVVRTISGNYLKLHSGGAIMLESTPACNTAYLPYKDKISNLCRIFEILSDAGAIRWENFDDQTNTRKTEFVKRKLSDTNPAYSCVIGYAGDSNETLVLKLGDGLPGGGAVEAIKRASGGSGTLPQVNQKLTLIVKTDGTLDVEWDDSGTNINWDESGKELSIKINGDIKEEIAKNITRKIEGEVLEEITKNLTQKIEGDVITEIAKTLLMKVEKQIDLQSEKINIGKSDLEKMTKGETLKKLLNDMLTLIISHNHNCAVGPTTPPTNFADFQTKQTVDLEKIISKKHYNE